MQNKIDFFNLGEPIVNELEMIALVGTGIAMRQEAPEEKDVLNFVTASHFEGKLCSSFKEEELLEEDLKLIRLKSEEIGCKTKICKKECRGCRFS